MTTYIPPKRAAAFVFYVSLVAQATRPQFKLNPTLAAGDFTISKDGGAFANLASLPTVTPSGGYTVQISLSSTEMTADIVSVICHDVAGAEWDDLLLVIPTAARQIDDLLPTASYTAPDNTAVSAIKAKTDNLPTDPADASDIVGAFSTVNTNVLSRLATAGYTAPPTVGDIADQVWDELVADHAAAGSTGAALSTAGAAVDTWSGEEGQAVYLGMLAIGAGNVTVSSPVTASGKVTLYSGYDHTGALRLTFTEPEGSTWPADLTGATVHLLARTGQGYAAVTADITGEVLVATGDEKVIRFAPTALETAPLTASTTAKYDLYATIATVDYPLVVGGELVVRDRIPE